MTGTKTTSGFTMLWATEEMVNRASDFRGHQRDQRHRIRCRLHDSSQEPCVLRGSEQRLPQNRTWLRRKRHPILGLQFDQPNRVLRRQRVVFRHCHQKVLLGDQSRRDPERRYGPPHHPDVESSIEQHQQRLVRESGTVEHEFDTGIRLSHQFRPPPDEQMRRGPRETQANATCRSLACRRHRDLGHPARVQNLARRKQQRFTGSSEPHSSSAPIEQRRTELFLELPDRSTQRRLRNPKPLRRTAEM